MDFTGWLGGSCVARAISNLGRHKNAQDAMIGFCQKELVFTQTGYGSKPSKVFNTLYTFYCFISGPEEPGHCNSRSWMKYGTEFADFIVTNGLGDVTTLPRRVNQKYHPDTDCQVWLWGPDQKAVEKWWKEVGSKVVTGT